MIASRVLAAVFVLSITVTLLTFRWTLPIGVRSVPRGSTSDLDAPADDTGPIDDSRQTYSSTENESESSVRVDLVGESQPGSDVVLERNFNSRPHSTTHSFFKSLEVDADAPADVNANASDAVITGKTSTRDLDAEHMSRSSGSAETIAGADGGTMPGTTDCRIYNNVDAYRRQLPSHPVRYILPVYVFGTGPTTLYRKIRWAITLAVHKNLGIIAVPFHNHITQDINTEFRAFAETYDLERLRQLLPMITTAQVPEVCGPAITEPFVAMIPQKNIFAFPVLRQYPTLRYLDKDPQSRYHGSVNISLPKKTVSMEEHDFEKTSSSCVGVIPYDMDMPCKNEINTLVDNYLIRPKYIRDIGEKILNKLCDGEVAAMHWRNKTGELCGIYHKCKPGKEKATSVLVKAVDDIVKGVVDITRSNNLTCLYVAKQKFDQVIISLLKKTQLRIFTMEDVLKLVPEIQKYQNDDYVISLIEQEFTEIVPLFISSRTSNWSFYVEYTRYVRNRKTVGLQEIPGLPDILRTGKFLLM